MTVHLKKVCQGLMAHLLIKNALYILIPSKLLNVSSDPQFEERVVERYGISIHIYEIFSNQCLLDTLHIGWDFQKHQVLNLGKYNTYGNIRGFVQYMSLVQWPVYRISSMNNCTLYEQKLIELPLLALDFRWAERLKTTFLFTCRDVGLSLFLCGFAYIFYLFWYFGRVLRWWIVVLSGHSLDRIVH